jgi:hypothetical protein
MGFIACMDDSKRWYKAWICLFCVLSLLSPAYKMEANDEAHS